jgi:hypothetical protein
MMAADAVCAKHAPTTINAKTKATQFILISFTSFLESGNLIPLPAV